VELVHPNSRALIRRKDCRTQADNCTAGHRVQTSARTQAEVVSCFPAARGFSSVAAVARSVCSVALLVTSVRAIVIK
jgi:hypothetical protein